MRIISPFPSQGDQLLKHEHWSGFLCLRSTITIHLKCAREMCSIAPEGWGTVVRGAIAYNDQYELVSDYS